MADRQGPTPGVREMVLCHACDNEWWHDEHGLECPQCHSDFGEIFDPNNDPRHDDIQATARQFNHNPDTLPYNPLHDHNPWNWEAPDPDEEDIEHVAFSPAPGIHFQRTSFRSSSSSSRGANPGSPNGNDIMGPIFQTFSSMLGGAVEGQGGAQMRQGQVRRMPGPHTQAFLHTPPGFATQNPFPPPGHHNIMDPQGPWRTNNPGTGRTTYTATARIWPQDLPGARQNPNQNNQPLNNFHAVMATMLQSMQVQVGPDTPPHIRDAAASGEASPFGLLLAQLLGGNHDPANAVHGDAVYTQEAFDRIIGQMMDQNNASHAPGPASAAAIAALPKKQVDKSMLGSDGKAECSVCMDPVEIGDSVTVLPCKHWFHGECVGAWLKEHDTCPHCRQGIMPRDAGPNANAPRSPEQPPRHAQNSFNPIFPNHPNPNYWNNTPSPPAIPEMRPMPGAFTQPGMQQPYVPGGYPQYPEPRQFVQPQQHQQTAGSFAPVRPQRAPLQTRFGSFSGPSIQERSARDQRPNGHGAPSTPLSARQATRPEGSRRSSRSSGHSTPASAGAGEGSSGVTGWFRNLRGGNRSDS